MFTILWSIALLILFFACIIAYWIILHNRLQRLQLRHEHFFQQLNVQLQRRRDLIPRLLNNPEAKQVTTNKKRPSRFAQKLLQAHRKANTAAWKTSAPQNERISGMQIAENELMLSLIEFVEHSPPAIQISSPMNNTSTSNLNRQNFITEELISTENRVAFAQHAYNDAIMQYNDKLHSIPTHWIANYYDFEVAEHIQGSSSKEYNKLKQRQSTWQKCLDAN
ncbi:MAG: LemA family protein [Mariprofundales bacterium]